MFGLPTDQIDERQQCKKEHSEGHQIPKLETLHMHHLHSKEWRPNHPATRLSLFYDSMEFDRVTFYVTIFDMMKKALYQT